MLSHHTIWQRSNSGWPRSKVLVFLARRCRQALLFTVIGLSAGAALHALLLWDAHPVGAPPPPPSAPPTTGGISFPNGTSPLSEGALLVYGPWILSIPASVPEAQAFDILLTCGDSEESEQCPQSYYVQFYGPAAQAVAVSAFRRVSATEMTASVTLHDAGVYQVYAWPDEAASCESKDVGAAVQNTPSSLHVVGGGGSGARITTTTTNADMNRPCQGIEDILDGRWIRGVENAEQRYAYTPYKCSLPHRSLLSALPLLPDLDHILFVGDSTTRDSLCRFIYPSLFAPSALGACEYNPTSKVWEHGNKHTFYHDPATGRSLEITFAFAHASIDEMFPFLDSLTTVPSVVVFNMGLWIDSSSDKEFRRVHKKFFDYIDAHWPSTHVVIRSATSVVTPIRCFQRAGHSRKNSARLRDLALEETRSWARRRRGAEGGKVGFVDAFAITDNRPETSVDGVHWVAYTDEERGWTRNSRPAVGEAEGAVVDWILDEIVTGRSMD